MTHPIDVDPFLLDCDGVVADCQEHLYQCVGYDGPPLTEWDFFAPLNPEQRAQAEQLLNKPDFWASLPIIPGATSGVAFLRHMGFQIHFVTSPWDTCPNWEMVRRDWLLRHFQASTNDVTITRRKYLIRGIALVDDKPQHVLEWRRRNPARMAILYAHEHNANVPTKEFWARLTWQTIPDCVETFMNALGFASKRLKEQQ